MSESIDFIAEEIVNNLKNWCNKNEDNATDEEVEKNFNLTFADGFKKVSSSEERNKLYKKLSLKLHPDKIDQHFNLPKSLKDKGIPQKVLTYHGKNFFEKIKQDPSQTATSYYVNIFEKIKKAFDVPPNLPKPIKKSMGILRLMALSLPPLFFVLLVAFLLISTCIPYIIGRINKFFMELILDVNYKKSVDYVDAEIFAILRVFLDGSIKCILGFYYAITAPTSKGSFLSQCGEVIKRTLLLTILPILLATSLLDDLAKSLFSILFIFSAGIFVGLTAFCVAVCYVPFFIVDKALSLKNWFSSSKENQQKSRSHPEPENTESTNSDKKQTCGDNTQPAEQRSAAQGRFFQPFKNGESDPAIVHYASLHPIGLD